MTDDKLPPRVVRVWLGAAAFVGGASVMVVEVVGTRMLMPVFGVGLFVWSALLVVTLGSLAFGYYLGGRVADTGRWPPLHVQLMLAGTAVAIAPFLRVPVLRMGDGLGLRFGPVISALVLFAPALFLLGMVSTTVVKRSLRDAASTGRTVGRVYAISTLGSLLGTLAAGFWLVPSYTAGTIFSGTAALLVLVGGLGFPIARRGLAGLALLPLVGVLFHEPVRVAGFDVLARRQSLHGSLTVVRDATRAVPLLLLRADHSLIGAEWHTGQPAFSFVHLLSAGIHAHPHVERALVIGLGVGSVVEPLQVAGATVDVVELDAGVVELAREHFGFRANGEVFVEDARTLVQRLDRKYDIIVHDTFTGGETPEHLLSVEVIRELSRLLTERGILTLNMVGASEGPLSAAPLAVRATLLRVFPHVRSFRDDSSSSAALHNIVQFASRSEIVFEVPAAGGAGVSRRSEVLATFQDGEIFRDANPGVPIEDADNPVAALSVSVSERFHEEMNRLYPTDFWID